MLQAELCAAAHRSPGDGLAVEAFGGAAELHGNVAVLVHLYVGGGFLLRCHGITTVLGRGSSRLSSPG